MCLPTKVEGATIQQIATIVANLLCLNFGLTFGITPSDMRLYRSAETPLNRPADEVAATWVAGHLFLSAAVGSLLFGFISPKIGPKSVLLLSGLLQIGGWFCIHFAYDIIHIYSSRMLAGLAAGATFTVLPVYISEISTDSNCAALTASIDQWRTLGIFVGFALGSYLRYDYISIVGLCVSFVFTMSFPFVQESPYYYKRKGNILSLEKSLRWFRGIRDIDDRDKPEFVKELAEFKSDMQPQSIAACSMSRAYLLKVSVVSLVLLVGAQFSGVLLILIYGAEIFGQYSTSFTTDVNVLILAAAQFIGAVIAAWIGQKVSRKILLSITALICGLSLVSLSLFESFGSQWQIDPLYAPWLPLTLLSLHVLFANIGLYPLATLIIGEMLPTQLRNKLSSLILTLSWLLLFVLIQCFYSVISFLSLVGLFWLFASVCIAISLFALFLLPETRGKSVEEVQQQMGYVANGSVAKISEIKNGHIKNGLF